MRAPRHTHSNTKWTEHVDRRGIDANSDQVGVSITENPHPHVCIVRGVLGGHQYAGAEGRCTQLPVVDQYTDEHSSGALVY